MKVDLNQLEIDIIFIALGGLFDNLCIKRNKILQRIKDGDDHLEICLSGVDDNIEDVYSLIEKIHKCKSTFIDNI